MLYFLKTEPGMTATAVEAIAQQIVDPQEGGYLAWDLVKKARESSAGSVKLLAAKLLEYLPSAANGQDATLSSRPWARSDPMRCRPCQCCSSFRMRAIGASRCRLLSLW